VTHVSVARPSFLDLENTPVSETIKRIVEFINATPKCTRRKLFDALAPAATPAAPATTEAVPAATDAAATPAPAVEPSPEQTAVNADLHWLIHQGHVIEFANGVLETAKKPLPKPVRQPKAAKPAAGAAPEAEAPESTESVTPEQIAASQSSDEVSSLPAAAVPAEAPATETPTEAKPGDQPAS